MRIATAAAAVAILFSVAAAKAAVLSDAGSTPAAADTPRNVLLLYMDDLRPVGTTFGEPEVLMPNLDALASKSVAFREAYVQAPTCGVSRSSLLTGRRPDTTRVLENGGCPFTNDPDHKSWRSLPEYFRLHGYTTAGAGKIFHPNICEGAAVGEWSASWSLPYYHAPCISLGSIYNGSCYEDYPGALPPPPGGYKKVTHAYANSTAADEDMPDGMIADHVVDILTNVSRNKGKPFFVAAGFHKPHLPHIAPKRYFDLYDPTKISLPAHENVPKNMPDCAWNGCGEWQSYADNKQAAVQAEFGEHKPFNQSWTQWGRHAYFAAASYGDAMIGKVLKALDDLNLADSTVVVLMGDHGWQVGEGNEWAKHTARLIASRAPLLFRVPGGASGVVSDTFAEMVDVFPTLADLAGVPAVPVCATPNMSATSSACTEGKSLASVVHDPSTPAKQAAFYQWKIGKHTGYTVVTAISGSRYRYTEWVKAENYAPVWSTKTATELYDLTVDPEENENIAVYENATSVLSQLSGILHAGWRGQQ